ncbi:MAG: hypothetical protein AAB474_01390, partial [Patescibacteria group bacterium]
LDIYGTLRIDPNSGLIIPFSSDPTINTSGQLAINTTGASTSLRFYDGSERALYVAKNKNIVLASSTLAYIGSYGAAGTTTILLMNNVRPLTLTTMYCKTDTGTAFVRFGDGTNWTDELNCSSTGVSDDGSIANNTWTMREDFKIQVGTQASNPNTITITTNIREDAD